MRFQLFEFTDLGWYPAFLKQPVVQYLDLASKLFGVFEPARTLLLEAIPPAEAVLGDPILLPPHPTAINYSSGGGDQAV